MTARDDAESVATALSEAQPFVWDGGMGQWVCPFCLHRVDARRNAVPGDEWHADNCLKRRAQRVAKRRGPHGLARKLTQTVTASEENGWAGNCWQTSIACLLDVDPETMPPQERYDWNRTLPDGTTERGPGYNNPLQAYLRTHHGLAYVEQHTPEELLPFLRVASPGWHLMTGTTVRSESLGGMRHVVVGRYGRVVWDPHPSQAGLLGEIKWAFLTPFPKQWERVTYREACCCPACKAESEAK